MSTGGFKQPDVSPCISGAVIQSRGKPDEIVEGGDHVWSAESPAAVTARRVVATEGRRRRQQRRERDARSGRIAGAREKFRNSHIIFHIGPIASIHT